MLAYEQHLKQDKWWGFKEGSMHFERESAVHKSLERIVKRLDELGVPYAVALGLIVAVLDLIPLAGATIAGIIIATVAFLHTIVAGIVVVIFFVLYQQLENHVLQPVVYNRTVALSPLAILLAVLVGAELAGVLGALAAIPVAGAIQVLIVDFLRVRRERAIEPPAVA